MDLQGLPRIRVLAAGRGKDYAVGEPDTTCMSKKALAVVLVAAAVLLYAKKR